MIVQLVEDLCYNVSSLLHGAKLVRVAPRSYRIGDTQNRLTALKKNVFLDQEAELTFEHSIADGKWISRVVDSNNSKRVIAEGYLIPAKDLF